MNKLNLLLLGPVTKDTIRKNGAVYNNIGGATYYQSAASTCLGANVTAVVTLAPDDDRLLSGFRPDVTVVPVWTDRTMVFENNYPDENNPNLRTQRALIPENPILPEHLRNVNIAAFDAVYLLPLCPFDIPLTTAQYVASFGKPVFVGAQGYLRHLDEEKVMLRPWSDFSRFAPYIDMLFADDTEAQYISDIRSEGLSGDAKRIASFNVETVITRGDKGAVVVSGHKEYTVPAFAPDVIVDPTGLGDTYMAAYTLQRLRGCGPNDAGEFAAVAATMKLEYKGAFRGSFEELEERMKYAQAI